MSSPPDPDKPESNPKCEYRNRKQIRNPNNECSKHYGSYKMKKQFEYQLNQLVLGFCHLKIVSNFEFRISNFNLPMHQKNLLPEKTHIAWPRYYREDGHP